MTLPKSGYKAGGGSGGGAASANAVEAAAVIPDNEIVRGDGGARGVQGSGITIADGAAGTLAGSNSGDVTLAGTPDYITLAGQVLTRTKLDPADDLNTFASSVLAGLLTDETGTDKVVFNTDPVFASTITVPNVGLHLLDTDASHDLIIKPGSDLTADHTLTVTTGDADRTLTLTGDASITGTNTGDGIGGSTGATDNRVLRSDGTGGATVQNSAVTMTDTGKTTIPIDDGTIGLVFGDTSTNGVGFRKTAGTKRLLVVNGADSGYGDLELGFIYGTLRNATSSQTITVGGTVQLANTTKVEWVDGAVTEAGTADTALVRGGAASVLRLTNGSTGAGALLHAVLVEANTAVAASPNVLTAAESGTVLTNEGTTAKNYHKLPTAVAGLVFEFVVQDADGIRIVANTADTIRVAATVSGAAGYTESTTQGDYIRLVAINATEWVAAPYVGTWTTV